MATLALEVASGPESGEDGLGPRDPLVLHH